MESSTFALGRCEPYDVLSVMSMLHRMLRAMKYSAKEEHFAVVAGAAVTLVLVGTLTYSLGEGWNVVDGSTSPSAR